MNIDYARDNFLAHYGILRKSGRYPWGSGGNTEQRSRSFLGMADDLKRQGLSDPEIAAGLGIGTRRRDGTFQPSTTDLRALRALAKNQVKAADVSTARRWHEKGMSNVAIGERMNLNESSVRALLKEGMQPKIDALASTAGMLKAEVARQGTLDIGSGVNLHLGVSDTNIRTAVAMLKEEGYVVHNVQVPQLGTNDKTTIKVLAPEGTTYRDIASNLDKVGSIAKYSDDGGRSWLGLERPKKFTSDRLQVNHVEGTGGEADGTMWVRRGAKDLSLGGSNYAQVRINVDDTHYLKGMAMYADTLPDGKPWPDGVDVIFNTNKSTEKGKLGALKPLKKIPKKDENGNILKDEKGLPIDSDQVDWDNPFGAAIKPGGQRGVFNVVNEEGDWDGWSRSLSSQMLSKQSNPLAKAQLDAKYQQKLEEFNEINSLTNPVVKRALLKEFAEDADASAVHLKAAGLPGQRTQVILPMSSMKDTEIYAPNFESGTSVVLVRYPHGGTFEIPQLTVNNKNPTARSIMGNAKDAVGINHKVAQQLSGADFDGDTVLVIPNNLGKVKTSRPLEALKGFDPQSAYPAYEGMPKLNDRTKQRLMGEVSNLITDMTIQGAPPAEIARAVKHSMVVIDAEKHNLNYKLSAEEQGIAQLKERYQGRHADGRLAGASTIISRAGSEVRVPARKERSMADGGPWDPVTGQKIYTPTNEVYTKTTVSKRTGLESKKTIVKTVKSKALAETTDAYKLTSGGSKENPGTPIEKIYAEHSNKMKALADRARRTYSATDTEKRSPSAAKVYKPQVDSLNAKLNEALRNAPLERKAQLLGNAVVRQKKQANPDMTHEEEKKIKGQALAEARLRVGAGKTRIKITPSEWEAIQSRAVSPSRLADILNNADMEEVKALATPRTRTVMTDAKMARAEAMLAAGHTQADIARTLGVPISTLNDAIS